MLKIEGLIEKSKQNFIKDPIALIIPHLEFPGKLSCDVKFVSLENEEHLGSIGYQNIPVENDIKKAYDILILEIE